MNFKIIDPFIGAGSGAVIACVVSMIVPAGWNMFLAMAVGGAVGMGLKFILLILLAPFFGAFEVMIPLSVIAMSVGMMSGMMAGHVPAWCIILTGTLTGFAVSAVIYYANKKLVRLK